MVAANVGLLTQSCACRFPSTSSAIENKLNRMATGFITNLITMSSVNEIQRCSLTCKFLIFFKHPAPPPLRQSLLTPPRETDLYQITSSQHTNIHTISNSTSYVYTKDLSFNPATPLHLTTSKTRTQQHHRVSVTTRNLKRPTPLLSASLALTRVSTPGTTHHQHGTYPYTPNCKPATNQANQT